MFPPGALYLKYFGTSDARQAQSPQNALNVKPKLPTNHLNRYTFEAPVLRTLLDFLSLQIHLF